MKKIPHCFIRHEKPRNTGWHDVEPYIGVKIIGISKGYTIPPGARYPTHCIFIHYSDGGKYTMGYFNCEENRDLAYKILENATLKCKIDLGYETYFKPIKVNAKTIADMVNKATVGGLLFYRIYSLTDETQSMSVKKSLFVNLWNEYPTNYEMTLSFLEQLLADTIPLDLEAKDIAQDLAMLVTLPAKLRKKKVPASLFYHRLVQRYFL